MKRIEERYRRVLRLLPRSYRGIWEEDMVSTFLAGVDTNDREQAEYLADYGRPSWPEVASIVALAVRLRIGTDGAPPRYAAWGHAVRLAALTVMLVNAAAGTVGALATSWTAGLIPLTPQPSLLPEPPGYPPSWHHVLLAGALSGLLWLLPFLALLAGNWQGARRRTLAAVVVTTLSAAVVVTVTDQLVTAELAYAVVVNALLLLALTAFHRGVPRVAAVPWRAAFGGCSVVLVGHVALLFEPSAPLLPLDLAGVAAVAVVIAVAVHVVVISHGAQRRFTAWTPALCILALVVLGLRLATLLDYARFGTAGWHPALVPLAVGESVAVAAAAAFLARLAGRGLRRLPAAAGDGAWSMPGAASPAAGGR